MRNNILSCLAAASVFCATATAANLAAAQTLATLNFDPTGRNPSPVQVPNRSPFTVTVKKLQQNGTTTTQGTADVFIPTTGETKTIGDGQSQCKFNLPNYGNFPMSFLARSTATINQIQVIFGGGGTTPICASR